MKRAKGISVIKVLTVVLTFMTSFDGVDLSLSSAQAAEGYTTAVHNDLVSLPPPQDKIVVAVYQFRDQRGQDISATATFSTAVAQGATSVLNKALKDSGWFVPIEREGLPSLLNERKIINSNRQQDQVEAGRKLPPLLYAGVLLEGGIIAHETNAVSADLKAKYFDADEPGQLRKDHVTVYLRLVYVRNGQILKSVSTTRSILSKEVDFGVYRFVRMKKLLEAEIGLSAYEPSSICAQEAIERAVFDLIVEGIQDGIWNLKDPQDIDSPVIQNYFEEKKQTGKMVAFVGKSDLVEVKDVEETEPEAINQTISEVVVDSGPGIIEQTGSEIVTEPEPESDVIEVESVSVVVPEPNEVVASETEAEETVEQSDTEEAETAKALEPDVIQVAEPEVVVVEKESETVVANLEVDISDSDSDNITVSENAEAEEAAVDSEPEDAADSEPNDVVESAPEVKAEPEVMVVEKKPEPTAANLQEGVGDSESEIAADSEPNDVAESKPEAEQETESEEGLDSSEPNDIESKSEEVKDSETEDVEASDPNNVAESNPEVIEEAEALAANLQEDSKTGAVAMDELVEQPKPEVIEEFISEEADNSEDTQKLELTEGAEASDANGIAESEAEVIQKPEPEVMVVEKKPEPAAANLQEGIDESESEDAAISEPNDVVASEPEAEEAIEQSDTEEVEAVEETDESEDAEGAVEESESDDVTKSEPNDVEESQAVPEEDIDSSEPNDVEQGSEEVKDSGTEDIEKSEPNDVAESKPEAEEQADSESVEESDSDNEEEATSEEENDSESSDDSKAWWEL